MIVYKPLTLRELNGVHSDVYMTLAGNMDENFVSVSGASNGLDLLNTLQEEELNTWLILVGTSIAGVFALGHLDFPSPDEGDHVWLQTSTYILSKYRRKGYNSLVKRAASKVFLNYPTLKLCSVVKDWDETSRVSLWKLFPTVTPVKQRRTLEQQTRDTAEYQYFYDLSQVEDEELADPEENVYNVLDSWLLGTFPNLNN